MLLFSAVRLHCAVKLQRVEEAAGGEGSERAKRKKKITKINALTTRERRVDDRLCGILHSILSTFFVRSFNCLTERDVCDRSIDKCAHLAVWEVARRVDID